MKVNWSKVVGYCQRGSLKSYELSIFQVPGDGYKWYIDKKNGECVSKGYGLTSKIAKQVSEITLKQVLKGGETYREINYADYSRFI